MQQITIRNQINKELDILPENLQRKVLDYITRLLPTRKRYKKRDGERLARLAGVLNTEDAKELMDIIDDGCENIDDEW